MEPGEPLRERAFGTPTQDARAPNGSVHASFVGMRSKIHTNPAFVGGIAVGLAFAGVAFLTVKAVGRARLRTAAASANEHMTFIDGVRPPAAVELDARPVEEESNVRLESEAIDAPTADQRW